jgi:RNA polymerase sigma factor (sigma-70 family)
MNRPEHQAPDVFAPPPIVSDPGCQPPATVPTERHDGSALLYQRYRRPLLARCRRLLGNPAEAEDAVQETFIRAHRHLDRRPSTRASVVGDETLRWLNRIATNFCLNHLRDQSRRAALIQLAGDPRPCPAAQRLVDRDLVGYLVASVPEPLARVAWLYHGAGLEQAEVAARLRICRRTVVNRIAAFARRVRLLLARDDRDQLRHLGEAGRVCP